MHHEQVVEVSKKAQGLIGVEVEAAQVNFPEGRRQIEERDLDKTQAKALGV